MYPQIFFATSSFDGCSPIHNDVLNANAKRAQYTQPCMLL